jgi:CRISPR-associated protein Csx14
MMAEASIPVDVFNPGQVFACLGFLEAADLLLGDAEGGFEWDKAHTSFSLQTRGEGNPFEAVLEFIGHAKPAPWAPLGFVDLNEGNGDDDDANDNVQDDASRLELTQTFPATKGDRMALPIRFGGGNRPSVELSHWADGSSRNSFKLYAGNRSANQIARAMLHGANKTPAKGVAQLWQEEREQLIAKPFDVLTPMGGSFNFDPRGAWTAIDVGYSPNDQSHAIEASPVVEFLAAWGLEHARPVELGVRQVRYSVWRGRLAPMLARTALVGTIPSIRSRVFRFNLDLSGKNKVVTFAQEEPRHDHAER